MPKKMHKLLLTNINGDWGPEDHNMQSKNYG